MKTKFIIWLFNRAFNGKAQEKMMPYLLGLYHDVTTKNKNLDEGHIIKTYRKRAKGDFKISAQIINVKKGKKKYDLLIMQTPQGNLKFNLGRHWREKELLKKMEATSSIFKGKLNLERIKEYTRIAELFQMSPGTVGEIFSEGAVWREKVLQEAKI